MAVWIRAAVVVLFLLAPLMAFAQEPVIPLEDARDVPGLLKLARSPDAGVRARVVRALGRVQSVEPSVLEALAAATRDGDGRVRAEAVFALGQEWRSAAEPALLKVLADPGASEEMRLLAIEGLGKSGTPKGVATLVGLVRSGTAKERAWAGLALGVAAYRDSKVYPGERPGWRPTDAQVKVLIDALSAPAADVRWGAAYALYRLAFAASLGGTTSVGGSSAAVPRASAALEAAQALTRRIGDGDVRVRLAALQALTDLTWTFGPWVRRLGMPDVLAAALKDDDWRVRAAAANLAARETTGVLDTALVDALTRTAGKRKDHVQVPHPNATVAVIRAIAARRIVAAAPLLREIAAQGLQSSAGDGPGDPAGILYWQEPIQAEAIRAQAVIAPADAVHVLRLAEASKQWRIRRAAVQGWAAMLEDDNASGSASSALTGLAKDADARVRTAVVEALSGHADHARQSLMDPDLVVRATAAEALGKSKDRESVPALIQTLDTIDPKADVEVVMAIVDALGAIGDRAAGPVLRRLALDPERNVAQHARDALKSLGLPAPATEVPAKTDPVPQAALEFVARTTEAGRQGDPLTATVVTSRGNLVLKLFPEEAPLTVYSYVTLARKGYFDGIIFHRVVPNFVVQGGDPRGDGWGGPGYTIRCEYNPLRYDRGAVGMALAGKDTGGSQWFITHSPQPHLNGRFTIFGQLVEGGDVLDSLTEGDRIVRIELSPALTE